MRDIKESNSKRIKSALEQHQKSGYYEVKDAYLNPSDNKYYVYEECKYLMRMYNGFDIRIISFNSFMFTVGFFGYIKNELYFFYIKPEHIRYTKI